MNATARHPNSSARLRRLWPVLLPLLVTLVVYRGVGGFDFVNFDDDLYVIDNPHVTGGLSFSSARWAFTTGHAQVWVPLTWLSFQLDAALSGPGPAGFHRTNLLLHLIGVTLVWFLGRRLTGSVGAATLAAALFGVHPLNVEAVAWVTARKDVLMAPLLLGAGLAWVSATGRWRLPVAGGLAIAAMLAKPAAVIAPALLLLLTLADNGRTPPPVARPSRRWLADLPFLGGLLGVAGIVAVITVRLARDGEMGTPPPLTVPQRIGDAVTGIGRYLLRLVWPRDLAVRYPESALRAEAVTAVVVAVAVLAVTVALVRWRRRAPLAAFGWVWFLVCLLPSSGLVQGGHLPMGDRYVYVGAVGLWFAGAGALARLSGSRPAARTVILTLASVAIIAVAWQSLRQVAVWRGSETLWRHALAVTRDNDLAHQNLAVVLDAAGRGEEALGHLDTAIAIRPRSATHFNAGNVNAALGRPEQAEAHYRAALKLNPGFVEAAQNLGSLLGNRGRLAEAREVLLAATERQPERASLQYNLAVVAWRQGDAGEAAARCRRALQLEPAHAGARDLLGRLAARPAGTSPVAR